MIGCIEAGGTKFVCGLVNEDGSIVDRVVIPTTTPQETTKEIFSYFDKHKVDAFGVASFGPVDLDKKSKTYGYITTTPKPGWAFTPVASVLSERYGVPVAIDTDVNAAALAEKNVGAAVGCDHVVYFTIGTGIGGGVIVNDQMVHGLMHPEFGHILIRRHPQDDFEGSCPFHSDCLEGLASGPSLEKRWGVKGHLLADDHIAWEMEAYYLAQACVNAIMTVSPQKIVLGGGVMHQPQLIDKIRKHVKVMVNDYIVSPLLDDLDNYIVLPGCGDDAGLLGAFALGLKAKLG